MAYLRQPKKVVARCPVCVWTNIYFSSDCARLTPELRASMGLAGHARKKHAGASIQHAQSLRPVMR